MWLSFYHRWENIATVANALTSSRVVLAASASALIALDGTSGLTSGLLLAAAATDGLDGYAARKLGQTTNFGKRLDPAVDALSIQSILLALAWYTPELHEKLAYTLAFGVNSLYSVQLFSRWKTLREDVKERLGASKIWKIKTATYLISLAVVAGIPKSQEWARWIHMLAEVWIFSW
jgi:phosphatidylglycerophosphate synthase